MRLDPTFSERTIASPDLERKGAFFLALALAFTVALSLGLALISPAAALFIPLLSVLAAVVVATSGRTELHVAALVVGGILLLPDTMSLHIGQIIHLTWFIAFILSWALSRGLNRTTVLNDPDDYLVIGIIVVGIGGGVALGLLYGGFSRTIFGEAAALLILALYFPAKEACRHTERAPLFYGLALAVLAIATVGSNLLSAREAIISATQEWQIVDVRAAGNEVIILVPTVGVITLLALRQSLTSRTVLLALCCLLLVGLVASKSRGYWIGLALGIFALGMALKPGQHMRFCSSLGVATVMVGFGAWVFLGDMAMAIVSGSLDRLATLSTAMSTDISMVDRYAEQRAMWDRIRENPILGYGFGTQYSLYSIQSGGTRIWSYAHNGFLALWYKTGLMGLLLMTALWIRAIYCGLRNYRLATSPAINNLLCLAFACALIALAPTIYTSNPFFHYASMIVITVCLAVTSGTPILPPNKNSTCSSSY